MFKFVIPAVAALGLVAFAAQSESVVPSADAKSEALAMGWHLSHEGAIAKLAYGVANSDQLALMITCEPGVGTAVVYGDAQPVGARLVKTAMGPAEIDPFTGEAGETRMSVRDAALTGLATRGLLTVEGDAGRKTISATPAEQRVVAGFQAYCASGVA